MVHRRFREPADFVRNDGKSAPRFACTCGLDPRVDRKDFDLVADLDDRCQNLFRILGFPGNDFRQRAEIAIEGVGHAPESIARFSLNVRRVRAAGFQALVRRPEGLGKAAGALVRFFDEPILCFGGVECLGRQMSALGGGFVKDDDGSGNGFA